MEIMKKLKLKSCLVMLAGLLIWAGCAGPKPEISSVAEVIDAKVTELYQTKSQEELAAITYEQAFQLFNEQELQVLSSKYWMFDVNVPVVVSVLRSVKQKVIPFWLEEQGFQKTAMKLKNEITGYEVWQKNFDAGHVGLGINGFENFGMHYLVSVGPQNTGDELELSNFFPKHQYVGTMADGEFTYHDWTELVLEEVPEALQGQKLLTTIRGRGTESHFVGAFRATEHPSSAKPDQLLLSWSDDPATTMDIQWRTANSVQTGQVEYREKGGDEVKTVDATPFLMEDLMLMNDRYCHRFTAQLRNLKPGTTYEYRLTNDAEWSPENAFTTQAKDDSFSFIWFGDTHFSEEWGKLLNVAFEKHPDAAFYSIVGDLVSDGLHRDQWDALWSYTDGIMSQRPMMSTLGNHDNRSGLGAWMYREMFSYPEKGPSGIIPEHTYAFQYKNTLFLMLDATSPVELQTEWIEQQLKNTTASWKIAMFHFPPYNWEEPYYDIQEAWVPVFDQYHVDLVFGGHIHYYMRSKPMKQGEVVSSYKDGTAYIISIGIPSRTRDIGEEPYAAVQKSRGQFYQYLRIDGDVLSYQAIDSEGQLADEFKLKK